MSFVRGGLELQVQRLYNLEDNLVRPDLRPEDAAALMRVAQMGYLDCTAGHHPQIAEQFTRLEAAYYHRFSEAGAPEAVPAPRDMSV